MKIPIGFHTLGILLGIYGASAFKEVHKDGCSDADIDLCDSKRSYTVKGETTQHKYLPCSNTSPKMECLKEKNKVCKDIHPASMEKIDKAIHKERIHLTRTCRRERAVKCHDFAKCLKPEVQKASHDGDIVKLCRMAPEMIDCFEAALAQCKKYVGAKDPQIIQLDTKLKDLERRAHAKCGISAASSYFLRSPGSWKTWLQVLTLPLLCLLGFFL